MVDSGWHSDQTRPDQRFAYQRLAADRSGGGLALGVGAGLIAALAGAIGWAVSVELTGYQLGFAAIGVGLLVGQAIALTAGASRQLPALAALLALLGCAVGDVLVDAHELATAAGMGTPGTLRFLITHPDALSNVFQAGFSPINAAFWAIAAGAGYRLAARGTSWTRETSAGPAPRAVAGVEMTGPTTGLSIPPGPVPAPFIAQHPSDFFNQPRPAADDLRWSQSSSSHQGAARPSRPVPVTQRTI